MRKYLPSKKFQLILLVCVLLAIVILGISFISKKVKYDNGTKVQGDLAIENNNTTLGDLIKKDTDGDGVPDWQEALWGTDPNKSNTFDGTPDRTYIDNKKKDMGVKTEDAATTANLTETEKFSREFLASFAALKASGQTDTNTINSLSTAIGKQVTNQTIIDQYTLKDIKTSTKDSKDAQVKYYNTVKTLYDGYKNNGLGSELDIINDGLVAYSSGLSTDQLDQLTGIAGEYQEFSQKMLNIAVPQSLSNYHLNIINSANNTGIAVSNMSKIVADPVIGLSGISEYQKYIDALQQNANDLATTVTQ